MTGVAKVERPTVAFTEEEYEKLIDDGATWRTVLDEMVDHRRWSVTHEIIIERLGDGTFWRAMYEVGATESQYYSWDEKWFDGDNEDRAVFRQVFPETVTTTVYS